MRIQAVHHKPGRSTLAELLGFYIAGSAVTGGAAWMFFRLQAPTEFSWGLTIVVAASFGLLYTVSRHSKAATSKKPSGDPLGAFLIALWSLEASLKSFSRAAVVLAPVSIAVAVFWRAFVGSVAAAGTALAFSSVVVELALLGGATSIVVLHQRRQWQKIKLAQHRTAAAQHSVARLSDVLRDWPTEDRGEELNRRLAAMLEPLADRRLWNDQVSVRVMLVDPKHAELRDLTGPAEERLFQGLARYSLARRTSFYLPRTGVGYALSVEPGRTGHAGFDWEHVDIPITRSVWRSTLCIPIVSGETTRGVVIVASPRPSAFSPLDLRFTEYLAEVIGESFELHTLLRTKKSDGGRRSKYSERHVRTSDPEWLNERLNDVSGAHWPLVLALRGFRRLLASARG